MSRLALVSALSLLGTVLVAQAQDQVQSQAVPPQTQSPTFRSRIDLVHLDVSVLDADRRPVRGLSAADFTITENGRPQQVAAFSEVFVPVPAAATASWIRDVAPDVRSNLDVRERRLFILAIDDATIQNDARALKAMKDIAASVIDKLGPSDLTSIVFARDNRNAQDFTSDRARLLKAIDGFTVGFRDQGQAVGFGGPTADDLWFLYSVGMLERAVDYLSDVPERRKAIIYVGQGLPYSLETAASPVNAHPLQTAGATSASMQEMRIKDQLVDAFDRAQRANVTIYAVDPCGLRTPPQPRAAGQGRPAGLVETCVLGPEIDYLLGLASATGGRTVLNTNEFEQGVTAIFEENAAYYLVGYQSDDPTRDGRFRQIDVKVNKPGVTVRARTGYDAPRDLPDGANRPAPSPLGTAIAGVLPKPDLPMQIMAAPFAAVGKGAKGMTVVIAVGLRQPIRQAGERVVEDVDLQIAAYNTDGRSFGNTRGLATVTIRPESSGAAQYEVFTSIDLEPGRYQLRIAANVGSFETAGSVYYDLDVPNLAASPLMMSGVLLTATPALPFGPKEGLGDLLPIVPTTRRMFSADHKVSAFARVYVGRAAKGDVTTRTTIRDSSDAVVFDRTQPLARSAFSNGAADVLVELPTAPLAPGDYVVTIESSLPGQTIRRDVRIQIGRPGG